MHRADDDLLYSATDLGHFLACDHLTRLTWIEKALDGPSPPKYDDPGLEVLWRRGLEHERRYLEYLKDDGARVFEGTDTPATDDPAAHWTSLAAETERAMRDGHDVVYQGVLFDAPWLGKPDFLVRVDHAGGDAPSALGDYHYEVADTKLARSAKAGAVLQITFYSELLARVQDREPEHMRLVLGGALGGTGGAGDPDAPQANEERFRYHDFAAYFRRVRRRFLETLDAAKPTPPVAPEPVPHCTICAWKGRCDRERHEVDHLSLVADITQKQRAALEARGVRTMAELAALPLPIEPRLDGVSRHAATALREQARIQVEGREAGKPSYELLDLVTVEDEDGRPVIDAQGLAALPAPSPGDLFFDFEGDPHVPGPGGVPGLEYLFGWVDVDGAYASLRALDADRERAAFERFIDFVMERLDRHPGMHVYHYAPYEPTALKRLMGRHGTREDEVDHLLRNEIFVDLHRITRQAVRASVESYSIKKMEPFYGFEREVELRDASSALAHFEALLQMGDARGAEDPDEADDATALDADEADEALDAVALFDRIEAYNRDDCASTLALRRWLEELRQEMAETTGAPVPRPGPPDAEPSEELSEHREEIARLVAALTDGVPADPDARSDEEHGRWLLAQLLDFHRREDKSFWWQYYHWRDMTPEERLEDRSALEGLEYVGEVGTVKRSVLHRYRYPRQEHDLSRGDGPHDPVTGSPAGTVWAVDEEPRTIDLKRGRRSDAPHPTALIPHEHIPARTLQDAIQRIAAATVERGLGDDNPHPATVELLRHRPPRVGQAERVGVVDGGRATVTVRPDGPLRPGDPLRPDGADLVDVTCDLALRLDRSVLPIQGPPGSGKTHVGAELILHLLAAGKRVGVCATSHKVIGNLLDKACAMARGRGQPIAGLQKAKGSQRCASEAIEATNDNKKIEKALDEGDARLVAGTAWLFSRPDLQGALDVLVIDEAGQFSLANTVAVSQAADSLVLLGDPRQLDQPQQGVHPPGAGASALEHLLEGEPTIAPHRGLFLDRTWRLHPDICAFTSELFYRNRLRSRAGLEKQVIEPGGPVDGAGIRYLPCEHRGNQSESVEEVALIDDLVRGMVDARPRWWDREQGEQTLDLDEILVIAPYNAQVNALKEALPDGARVGTVDIFQGQQAALVVYSMTSSTPDDAPRGMSFLYSPNRLNVATSRAKCLAVAVGSPALFGPDCSSPEQMRLANAFCRLWEMGRGRLSRSTFLVLSRGPLAVPSPLRGIPHVSPG